MNNTNSLKYCNRAVKIEVLISARKLLTRKEKVGLLIGFLCNILLGLYQIILLELLPCNSLDSHPKHIAQYTKPQTCLNPCVSCVIAFSFRFQIWRIPHQIISYLRVVGFLNVHKIIRKAQRYLISTSPMRVFGVSFFSRIGDVTVF